MPGKLSYPLAQVEAANSTEGISAVVCCFNSAQRIEQTLEHLFTQKGLLTGNWEIIVVDNASTDNTATLAADLYNKLTGIKPAFKIVKESKPGLANARLKGIAEARFDYIAFCDDDNWLSSFYLADALNIMKSHENIGVLGGFGEPVFEREEPPYFWKNQVYLLALGPQSNKDFADLTDTRKVVYGAGMVINKKYVKELLNNYDFTFQTAGRTGDTLISGEDYELCSALRKLGYKVYYSSKLKFKHFIPHSRTQIAYYKKLTMGFGLSQPLGSVYGLTKANYNYYKHDYRYLLLRQLKNMIVSWSRLFARGYFFSRNKYKYIEDLECLYTNYGAFIMTMKVKNTAKTKFMKTKIFLAGEELGKQENDRRRVAAITG